MIKYIALLSFKPESGVQNQNLESMTEPKYPITFNLCQVVAYILQLVLTFSVTSKHVSHTIKTPRQE